MALNFDYLLEYDIKHPFNKAEVISYCKQYSNKRILIEIPNTCGITSKDIRELPANANIRIAGAYDNDRLDRYKYSSFGDETVQEYYYESVIYTRSETIKILEEMESIEQGIKADWSDLQKVIYIYDKLKRGILYAPKFEVKKSKDIRSLRGLITKQTVCAGYALILKEMLDRQHIKCYFVRGGRHAWNIIQMEDQYHALDLTSDNTQFRHGHQKTFDYLGQDIEEFNASHHPNKREPMYGYEKKLVPIERDLIQKYSIEMGRTEKYGTTIYYGSRHDGSRFIVTQVGDTSVNDKRYYRYYYADLLPDGSISSPLILYSDYNISMFINKVHFNNNYKNKDKLNTIADKISNILFAKENIADSLANHTSYIGNICHFIPDTNKVSYVQGIQDVTKSIQETQAFRTSTKSYQRQDGSIITLQEMPNILLDKGNINLRQYDIFEMYLEKGKSQLKKDTIYTERSLFYDQRKSLVDEFLSQENIAKSSQFNGYMGYYDVMGMTRYNPDILAYFSHNDLTNYQALLQELALEDEHQNIIPDFNDLHTLALTYEAYAAVMPGCEFVPSKVRVREIKTKKMIIDRSLFAKAILANVWLAAAGIKNDAHDTRTGEIWAFSSLAQELYDYFCSEMRQSIQEKRYIDTIALFRKVCQNLNYHYAKEILVNLFSSPYQTELINNMFLEEAGYPPNSGPTPEPLYSLDYANRLISTRKNNYH